MSKPNPFILSLGATIIVAFTGLGGAQSAQAREQAQHSVHHGGRHRLDAACIYHGGLMVGETPNIDRLAKEGSNSSTTRHAELHLRAYCFLDGHVSSPRRSDPAATSGQPDGASSQDAALAKVLLDLGYNTGQFGKNHLGDKDYSLPTAHGAQEFFGYLYHLDAMQGVSFERPQHQPHRAGRRRTVRQHTESTA